MHGSRKSLSVSGFTPVALGRINHAHIACFRPAQTASPCEQSLPLRPIDSCQCTAASAKAESSAAENQLDVDCERQLHRRLKRQLEGQGSHSIIPRIKLDVNFNPNHTCSPKKVLFFVKSLYRSVNNTLRAEPPSMEIWEIAGHLIIAMRSN